MTPVGRWGFRPHNNPGNYPNTLSYFSIYTMTTEDEDDMEEVLEQGRQDYPSQGQRAPNLEKLFSDMGDDVNSLGRGLSQGGTMNLHDEAVAGIKAGGKTLYDYAMKYLADGGEPEGLSSSYTRFRDQERKLDHTAQEESPLAFGTGQFAGAAAIPGSSVESLAAQGAASGYGASEADSFKGDLSNAAAGAAIGAGIGKFSEGLGRKNPQPEIPIGKGQTERVLPKLPEQKGELDIHRDVIDHESKNKEVQDRIKAFRAKQLAGNNVNYKSDQIAKEMYGLDPTEGSYNPYVEETRVPEGERLFGVAEREFPFRKPGEKLSDEDMLLIGRGSFPPDSKIPVIENPLEEIAKPAAAPEQAMQVATVLQQNPEQLGPYAKILMDAARKGTNSFLTTSYVLMTKDPKFKKLMDK